MSTFDAPPTSPVHYEIEGELGQHNARHTSKVRRAIKVVVGGYDVAQVDNLLSWAENSVVNGGEVQRARARQALRSAVLARRPFGYARAPVHSLLEELGRQLGAN